MASNDPTPNKSSENPTSSQSENAGYRPGLLFPRGFTRIQHPQFGDTFIRFGNPPKREMSPEEDLLNNSINMLAMFNNFLKMINYSIDDIDNPTRFAEMQVKLEDQSELFCAKLNQCFSDIEKCIASNAKIDIDYQDQDFKVAYLHTAAGIGSFKLTKLLLPRNPNPNLTNCFGQTPAMRARNYVKNEALAQFLEQYQAEYNKKAADLKGKDEVIKCENSSNDLTVGDKGDSKARSDNNGNSTGAEASTTSTVATSEPFVPGFRSSQGTNENQSSTAFATVEQTDKSKCIVA